MAFDKIGVVGAGLMGSEIALVFAMGGCSVALVDVREESLALASQRIERTLTRGVERGFFAEEIANRARGGISMSVGNAALAPCDLVVEAVFENLELKTSLLKELDELCQPLAWFASNTSTIPISTLAAALSSDRAARFLGAHFFSPASRMQLVEVIPSFFTSEETTVGLTDLLASLGKKPVRVKDVAGFAVNRMLHVMMIEAVRLVEEGVATPEDIDTACRSGLGHPMGPFELMDVVTSRLCLEAQEIMHEAYGERFRPRPLLKQRVQAGLVGGAGRPGWRS